MQSERGFFVYIIHLSGFVIAPLMSCLVGEASIDCLVPLVVVCGDFC